MYALSVTLFLLAQVETVPATEIWPQWRGPTGDSVTPAKAFPTRWSKTENVAWKAALPGWSNSTPAIWRDALFLTTQEGDKLFLMRLDAATGKTVWQREVGAGTMRRKGPTGIGRYHDEHNLATPSPVTDGKHVSAHFGTGDLMCFDFAGNKIWDLNLTGKYGPYTIWWGHANSPVLVGDLLVSVCMQDPKDGGQSYVVAHDKLTGKEKWTVKRVTGHDKEWADSYTTPIVRQTGGKTELIVYGGNVLDAYDPATGQRLWHTGIFSGNRVISGPTLAGDTVYAIEGMKGPLFAIKAGGAGDITKSSFHWKYTSQNPDAASPVVANGLVFLAANNGLATCLDAQSGKEMWKERLAKDFRATPLVVGDLVYFAGKDGKTKVVAAKPTFEVVAESDLGEEIIASLAAASGRLFARTKGHLYCIGK